MIITTCTVFVVLPSWQEFTQFLWWIQTAGVEPSQPDWAVSSPVGCYRPCLPSLFVIKYWKLLLTVCCEISWTKICVVHIAQHHWVIAQHHWVITQQHWVIAQRRWVFRLDKFIVLFLSELWHWWLGDWKDVPEKPLILKDSLVETCGGGTWSRFTWHTHTHAIETTRVSWCQEKSSFGFYRARGDRYQRQTNRQSGLAPLHPD